MSDYKGIFAQEDFCNYEGRGEYEVRVIHRKTNQVVWIGEVIASSKKDAQRQWREEYSHIRSRYTHEYGLGISRIEKY